VLHDLNRHCFNAVVSVSVL